MVKYFQGGEDEAEQYTKGSGQKIYPICPDCGKIKNERLGINDIYKNDSIGCICGDGIKYPEKFMLNVLEQLKIEFVWQLSRKDFKWCKDKRFDFYIPSLNLIIEMDGRLGHGNKDTRYATKEESKLIDDWKDKQAKLHGMKVIRIDCDYGNDTLSRFGFIKNNILNSELSYVYDLSNINWNKAHKFALGNLIKNVCEYYEMNLYITQKELIEKFKLSNATIINYLKQGKKVGWCNYKGNKKKVLCIELNEEFESANECSRQMSERYGERFIQSSVSYACRYKGNRYKGFTFKYV